MLDIPSSKNMLLLLGVNFPNGASMRKFIGFTTMGIMANHFLVTTTSIDTFSQDVSSNIVVIFCARVSHHRTMLVGEQDPWATSSSLWKMWWDHGGSKSTSLPSCFKSGDRSRVSSAA